MARQGHRCWSKPYSVITRLYGHHPPGQKKGEGGKHVDGVRVRPGDRVTNAAFVAYFLAMFPRSLATLMPLLLLHKSMTFSA